MVSLFIWPDIHFSFYPIFIRFQDGGWVFQKTDRFPRQNLLFLFQINFSEDNDAVVITFCSLFCPDYFERHFWCFAITSSCDKMSPLSASAKPLSISTFSLLLISFHQSFFCSFFKAINCSITGGSSTSVIHFIKFNFSTWISIRKYLNQKYIILQLRNWTFETTQAPWTPMKTNIYENPKSKPIFTP